jgi:ABC-2 type transport system permease protein
VIHENNPLLALARFFSVMLKLIAIITKEILLLLRDRTGLLVLFLMPAILVVIITLVQENIMELTGQKKTKVLFLDQDQGDLSRILKKQLESSNLELLIRDKFTVKPVDIQEAVIKGDYQIGIVIPEGASFRFNEAADYLFQKDRGTDVAVVQDGKATALHLFIDPCIMAGLRSSVTASLEMALTVISLEAKIAAFSKAQEAGINSPFGLPTTVALKTDRLQEQFRQPLLILTEKLNNVSVNNIAQYNPVQQNVPAWALFGMFFTAIPIAGSILQEYRSGIRVRLMALPVSPLVLIIGKACAYMSICICQFLLITAIGTFLFPLLGLPVFTTATNLPAVMLTVLFASLAACGYGVFLGTICNSYEQASTLGATSVVAAAAIGGVMVPVYAMPLAMQNLSIISPLNWGLTAFYDLLLRGASLVAILDDLGRMLLFFVVCVLLSWKFSLRQQ